MKGRTEKKARQKSVITNPKTRRNTKIRIDTSQIEDLTLKNQVIKIRQKGQKLRSTVIRHDGPAAKTGIFLQNYENQDKQDFKNQYQGKPAQGEFQKNQYFKKSGQESRMISRIELKEAIQNTLEELNREKKPNPEENETETAPENE